MPSDQYPEGATSYVEESTLLFIKILQKKKRGRKRRTTEKVRKSIKERLLLLDQFDDKYKYLHYRNTNKNISTTATPTSTADEDKRMIATISSGNGVENNAFTAVERSEYF